MKLLENDKIYIQAKDLAILFNTDNAIPFSVFGITLSNHNWAKKGHDFDFIVFDESFITYFNEFDWIIDFNKAFDLDEGLIKKEIKKHQKILEELDTDVDMNKYEKEKNIIFDLRMILSLKNEKRFVMNKIDGENKRLALSKRMYYITER